MTSIFLSACRFAANDTPYSYRSRTCKPVLSLIVTLRGFQVTLSPRICRGTNGAMVMRPTENNSIDCKTLMLASRADTFHLTLQLTVCFCHGALDKSPIEVAAALRRLRQLQYFGIECPDPFAPWLEMFTDSEQYGEIPIRELHQLWLWTCNDVSLPLMQRLVARFPTIQELNVALTAFGSAELEFLATSPLTKSLRKLVVASSSKIDNGSLRYLTAFQHLQELYLTGCDEVSDAGIAHVARLEDLQLLNIAFLPSITDVALKHLSALRDLRSLDCSQCSGISNEGLRFLLLPSAENGGAGCKLLQHLTFTWCDKITDDGLGVIAETLRDSLESLSLRNCNSITVDGLLQLSGMQRLRKLDVVECKLITAGKRTAGLLKQAMPHNVEITLQ